MNGSTICIEFFLCLFQLVQRPPDPQPLQKRQSGRRSFGDIPPTNVLAGSNTVKTTDMSKHRHIFAHLQRLAKRIKSIALPIF